MLGFRMFPKARPERGMPVIWNRYLFPLIQNHYTDSGRDAATNKPSSTI
jgi:hypothetical protein